MPPSAPHHTAIDQPSCSLVAPTSPDWPLPSSWLLRHAERNRPGWLYTWLSHTRVEITLWLYTVLTSTALLISGFYFWHLSHVLEQTAPLLDHGHHLADSAIETAWIGSLLFLLIPVIGIFSPRIVSSMSPKFALLSNTSGNSAAGI